MVDRASIPELGLAEPASSAPRERAAGGPAAWLAAALPLAFGLWSASGQASWAEDAAIVRDLGLLPVGSEGALSTLLTQLLTLLPLGGRVLRASLVGVFALALASRLLFGEVLSMLERRSPSPLNPLLASLGSATWALGAPLLAAALHVGGPLPALALMLLGLVFGRQAFERGDVRALAATGLVLAATLTERRTAGVSLAFLLLGLAVVERRGGWQRGAWRLVAGLSGGLLLFGSLRVVGSWGAAPSAASAEDLARGFELAAGLRRLPQLWASELGSVPLLLALLGIGLTAAGRSSRRLLWPWVCCAVLGALLPSSAPANEAGLFSALAGAGIAVFFPLGLQAIVRWSWASPLPFGRPAAVLSITFAGTLVLSRADRASGAPSPAPSASVWTDEALMRLPPRSFLLLNDEALAMHLLGARAQYGARPDVAILATTRLSVRDLRQDPDLADPALLGVLRQLWVNGSVDEYALSKLADERPVFAQPEPDWERRMLGHVVPEGVWLRFAPQGVGSSERRAGTLRSRAALRRALDLAGTTGLDAPTRRTLAAGAERQAAVLAKLGERVLAGRMAHAARFIQRGARAGELERVELRGRVAARAVSR